MDSTQNEKKQVKRAAFGDLELSKAQRKEMKEAARAAKFASGAVSAKPKPVPVAGELVREAHYAEPYNQSVAEWMNYHQDKITFGNVKWMGVNTLHLVFDLWIYQEIIFERKPDIIVEIGSSEGGTALFLSHLCDVMGNGQVLSIDIIRPEGFPKHPRLINLDGRSDDAAIIEKVKELSAGKKVMVIHDGDHTREAVLKDLNAYSPFVTTGQYYIMCDGVMDVFARGTRLGKKREGPLPAIRDFVAEHPEFRIDFARERYQMTYNPHGYLEKIAQS